MWIAVATRAERLTLSVVVAQVNIDLNTSSLSISNLNFHTRSHQPRHRSHSFSSDILQSSYQRYLPKSIVNRNEHLNMRSMKPLLLVGIGAVAAQVE